MSRTNEQAGIQAGDVSAMAMMNMAVNSFGVVSQANGAGAVGFPAGTATPYATDQHRIVKSGSFTGTIQQVPSPFPSMPNLRFGHQITIGTASAALAAGDYLLFSTPIEGHRMRRLAFGNALASPFTMGFVIRPTIPLTFYAGIYNDAANRSIAKRYVAPANTDTFVPLDFDGEKTGVWNAGNTRGCEAFICLGCGSTLTGNPGGWLNAQVLAGADQTNLAAVSGYVATISGIVMLPGRVPLSKEIFPFLARHDWDEARLCRRYWRRNPTVTGTAGSATLAQGWCALDEPMRTTPGAGAFNIAQCVIQPYIAFFNLASITGVGATQDIGGLQLDYTVSGGSLSVNVPVYLLADKLALDARM